MNAASRVFTVFMRRLLALVLMAGVLAGCTTRSVMETAVTPLPSEKYAAIVVDASTGRVLYDRHGRDLRYPASLTKMMTLYMLFEAIDEGRIGLESQIPFSAYAASRPPSRLGLRAGESIDTRTAIMALCVRSANDVAAAVAEYLGVSEERFAAMMTSRARSLGMRSTTFRNASGLPDAAQMSTAHDMAILSLALRKRFPHYYHYFQNREFSHAGKLVRGHNDLLLRPGVDGIKTGYTRASGFNVATSAALGGRRIIVVVMGGETAKSRNAHVEELIDTYLPRASVAGAS